MNKDSLRGIISVVVFAVSFFVTAIGLSVSSSADIIINRGAVSNYSLYGEYENIVKVMDYSQNIVRYCEIIFLILLVLFCLVKLISNKNEKLKAPTTVLSYIVLVTSIISLAFAAIDPVMTVITGVDVNSCWCGPDYVKIEKNTK